ncbi:DNA-3-methyladenine glycosylase [Nocardioides sp. BP30]|uniref:DNA-3-methyladenine glycosylase n=1 Tax=Nocardioides sp. BP30 TaxID=3036374 RepID=UPI002469A4C0|nr:DNA-3-methyladenine glycosylase [Nocardioides sp. BP30]WGL50512.1 DNA-3-methyladenine glycosylase [Nocardioides sp. BP30]
MSLEEALDGPAESVAPRLLGALLTHAGVTVRLTEVEAYAGALDPGSHAYRGRTARNEVMFGPAGRLYVYFTYGMHTCANVVCAPDGEAAAVLLRAGEIVGGIELARERRQRSSDRDLARGPARLCRALDLSLGDYGADLSGPTITLRLADPAADYLTGPRVGLRAAADRPWRFWLPGEPSVSAYRPAKRLEGRD